MSLTHAAGTAWKPAIGDLVTRDGTDIHIVIEVDDDLITVTCIKEPAIPYGCDEPWIRVGEVERNLTRRYEPVALTDITPPPA